MNTLVQAINSAGQAFVEFALPMLVQTSVLILVVLLINLALRRRVRATFRYWIWMVVLVKFVLPPSLWSPVSVGSWFGEELETPTVAVYEAVETPSGEDDAEWVPNPRVTLPAETSTWVKNPPYRQIEPSLPVTLAEPRIPRPDERLQAEPDPTEGPFTTSQPTAAAPTPSVGWQGFVVLVWGVVAIALLLLLLQRALFVVDLIAQAEPAPAFLQRTLDDCRARMGLTWKTKVKVSSNAVSPAVCGLFSPVILVPRRILAKLTPADLQAVLLHELAHIKRTDLWVNLFQTLLQIVYFYNPLLWLANAMIRRVREKAVDETVLVAMGETARRYPETLLTVAKLAFKRRPALSLRLIGVVESKSLLTSRIKHILGRPIPRSAKLSVRGLAVVLLLAAIFLPMAKARPLTDRAANIRSLARQEARTLNHAYIGTEHILLALARQDESISAKVLNNLGITINALRAETSERLKPGPKPVTETRLQRTAAAKRIMRHARKEARALHHDYIGTEHMLLGLMNESDSVAAEILADLDVTRQKIKGGILTLIQPGNGTPTRNDSDDDELLGADGSKSRRFYLPDLETPDVNVVLDLASGQMLSAEPMERNRNHFAKLGKGDIVYEHAQNKDGLLCLRGARMQRRAENGLESLPPDVTRETFVVYFIEHIPSPFQITTAEGQIYDITVLSLDGKGCTLTYTQVSDGKGAGGGALAGPHEADSRRTELSARQGPDGTSGLVMALEDNPAIDNRECMKLLGLAVALYVNEHDGQLPDAVGPLEPYFSKPGVFAWVRENVTYTGKGNVKDYSETYAVVTGYETAARPTGQRYVTFLDGHVALVEADRFEELVAATAKPSGEPVVALQQMVDEAEPGSVVTVPKGTYTEPIEITKPITLRGVSRADCVFEVTADRPAIWVNTGGQGGVALEDLTVRWQLASQDRVERPFALGVKDNKIVVRNCRFAGMGDYRRSGVAINIEGSPKAAIDDCHLAGFEYVVCIRTGTEAVVEDCIITDCGHQGVINYSGSTMTVRRCIITGSKYHAVRCTGGTLHVRDNLLISNANRALYLGNRTGRGTVINNLIVGNGTGISGFGGAAYTIENNVITNNDYAGISMRDFCHLSIGNNVLVDNGRGVILHKEAGQDTNQLAVNLFWNNNENIENFDKAVTLLPIDPQFVDPNGGDFSVQGPAKEQGQGLTDPEIIKQLWKKLESQPQVLETALQRPETPPSPQPASPRITGNLAWQRTDRYVPPNPKEFFPDDAEAGKRLDALFQAVDKDRRNDEEILSTVRQGFARTTQHRTLILRWIGNRYIWGKDPQNAQAIEIMYHAVAMERHYAVYFGLSVMKHKTPNVLRTLADICAHGEDVGRITWGLGGQRQEIVPYIEPYLRDADTQTREIAAVLVRHFKGELDFEKWQAQKRLEHTKAQFGDQLPQIKETLLTGDSRARRETMTLIQRNQITALFDASFLPAMAACATDPDRKVRNEAARMIGGGWIWRPGEQDPNAVALMLTLASDEDREVRYNAVYFGLSVVRDKTEPIVRRLVEMALADHENNLYGRITWGLKGSMRDNPDPFKAILAEYVERAKSDIRLAASIDTLYRDVLDSAPSDQWQLGDIEEHYPSDLVTVSFSAGQSFEPKDADALWAEFLKGLPDGIVLEPMPSYRGRDSKTCTAKIRGQEQADIVKNAIEKNPNLVFGRITPLPIDRQLYLEERFGMIPVPPATSPSRIETGKPAAPTPDQGPGPIQRRISAAAPGDTIMLEPGVYEEHLVIDKPLTLQGAGWEQTTIMTRSQIADLAHEIQEVMRERLGAATSDAERQKIATEVRQSYKDKLNHPTLLVTGAKDVVIRGVKFGNPGQHIEGSLASLSALRISDSQVHITDCAVLGAVGNGIHIVDDSHVEIDNALVAATWSTGIVVGEKATRPSRVHIHDSDIRNNHYAEIRIGADNDQVRIERCRISGAAWHGIRYDNVSPTIENNLIFGNARSGIYASGQTAAAIHGNLFYANEGGGMSCWFRNTDRIENNTFVDNKRLGLSIVGASKPILRKNIFSMHPTAVIIADVRDESPWAKSDGTIDLQNSLFWENEHEVQRYEDEAQHAIALGQATETLRVDPRFTAPEGKDFTLKPDSPAREAGVGALDLIPFQSPWPLQPEERAIIPNGPTRDYRQWKGKD